jgi:hypothetical protein
VYWLLALVSLGALCLTQGAVALILMLPLLRFAAQGYLPFEQLLKIHRTCGASRAVVLSAYNMIASIIGITLGPLLGAGTGIATANGIFTGFVLILLSAQWGLNYNAEMQWFKVFILYGLRGILL